jgi:hypothetical protein
LSLLSLLTSVHCCCLSCYPKVILLFLLSCYPYSCCILSVPVFLFGLLYLICSCVPVWSLILHPVLVVISVPVCCYCVVVVIYWIGEEENHRKASHQDQCRPLYLFFSSPFVLNSLNGVLFTLLLLL